MEGIDSFMLWGLKAWDESIFCQINLGIRLVQMSCNRYHIMSSEYLYPCFSLSSMYKTNWAVKEKFALADIEAY